MSFKLNEIVEKKLLKKSEREQKKFFFQECAMIPLVPHKNINVSSSDNPYYGNQLKYIKEEYFLKSLTSMPIFAHLK